MPIKDPTPEMLIESIRTELRLLDEGVIRPVVALSWIKLYLEDFKQDNLEHENKS